jgi:hypothetical protein
MVQASRGSHQEHSSSCGRVHASSSGVRSPGRGRTLGDIVAYTRVTGWGCSELDKLLEDERQQPIKYSYYDTDNIQKSRQDFLRNSIEKAMMEATDHEWNGKLHISNNSVDGQKLLAALQRQINMDMDLQACEEALAGLSAYYKVDYHIECAKSNADFFTR